MSSHTEIFSPAGGIISEIPQGGQLKLVLAPHSSKHAVDVVVRTKKEYSVVSTGTSAEAWRPAALVDPEITGKKWRKLKKKLLKKGYEREDIVRGDLEVAVANTLGVPMTVYSIRRVND